MITKIVKNIKYQNKKIIKKLSNSFCSKNYIDLYCQYFCIYLSNTNEITVFYDKIHENSNLKKPDRIIHKSNNITNKNIDNIK
jgi:hypothetical protein